MIWLTLTLHTNWQIHDYLKDKNPHSYYDIQSFEVPHYAYLHKQNSQIYPQITLARKAHSFARLKFGKDLVLAEADDFTMCIEMIELIKYDQTRPEYINLTEAGC